MPKTVAKMELLKRIENIGFKSNTYLFLDLSKSFLIIVDPGEPEGSILDAAIQQMGLPVGCVLLTHEHYDHMAGLKHLCVKYPSMQILASKTCYNNLQDDRKSLRRFVPSPVDLPDFSGCLIKELVDTDWCTVMVHTTPVHCLLTPGHSEGGMCCRLGQYLITGDTLMGATKVPVNLPGSNRADLAHSLEKLSVWLQEPLMVLPGHGLPYPLKGNFLHDEH